MRILCAKVAVIVSALFYAGCSGGDSSSFPAASRLTESHLIAGAQSTDASSSGGEQLYIVNSYDDTFDIFAIAGDTFRQTGVVGRGLNLPFGIAIDAIGNAYVSNYTYHSIDVYYKGYRGPSRIYTKDITQPYGIAVANDGTIYLANATAPGWVSVYPQGDEQKEYRLSDFGGGGPFWITLDQAQDAYVLYSRFGSGRVKKYAPGATRGVFINLDFTYGNGIALDAAGNIILSEEAVPSAINVYAPGSIHPFKIIPLTYQPGGIALSADGKTLFVADPMNYAVHALRYPSGTLAFTIAGISTPTQLAVKPRPHAP